MTVAYIYAVKRELSGERSGGASGGAGIIFNGILSISPAFIILGGIISGIFTATESGAIAVVYAFILAFGYYRDVPVSRMWSVLKRTLRTVLMVYFLIAASAAFGYVMAYLSLPDLITSWFLSVSDNKYVILLMINILLLILGGPMDMAPMILILTPVLLPVATAMGMDPVHFGLMLIFNAGYGIADAAGRDGAVYWLRHWRYQHFAGYQGDDAVLLYVMLVVLVLITYIPQTVLWSPPLFK